MIEQEAADPMNSPAGLPLVPGRECGECVACCIHLTIRDPALTKAQGLRCPHLAAASGCGIYAVRPATCRSYHCGWRLLKWVRESLRPDRSHVLIGVRERPVAYATADRQTEMTLSVLLLSSRAMAAEGLPETIAAAIAGGVRVFVEVPGRPGYTSAVAELTDALQDAVRTRDKPAVLALLRRCWAEGRKGGQSRIRLARGGAGGTA